jgi:uncharacterized glyoxalase superfamily protein PhnB
MTGGAAARARWVAAPVLGVRNVRRAAEHWRDMLGFHLDPESGVFDAFGSEPDGVYAIVERGACTVHFQIRRGAVAAATSGPRPALERDVYVYVHDVAALHAELVARGAKLQGPPANAPYGFREIVAEDLDGHRVTFGQPL